MAGEEVRMAVGLRNISGSPQEVRVRMTAGIGAIESVIFVSRIQEGHQGMKGVNVTVSAENVLLYFFLRAVPGAEKGCADYSAIIERPGLRGSFYEIGRIRVAENLCVAPSISSHYTPPSLPEDEGIMVGKPFSSTLRVKNLASVTQPFCVVPEVIADGSPWSVSTITERLKITVSVPFSTLNPSEVKPWEELKMLGKVEWTLEITMTVLPIGKPPETLSISFKAKGFLEC